MTNAAILWNAEEVAMATGGRRMAGEGTWTVDGTSGAVTFTPEADFAGAPPDGAGTCGGVIIRPVDARRSSGGQEGSDPKAATIQSATPITA